MGTGTELCPLPAPMPRPCLVSVQPCRPLCVLGRWGTYGQRQNSQSLETACNWFLPSTSCDRGLHATLECGHGMHNPSCHHAADTVSRMCRDGSGLQGVSLGIGTDVQGIQMGFESSPNILLPFFFPRSRNPTSQRPSPIARLCCLPL